MPDHLLELSDKIERLINSGQEHHLNGRPWHARVDLNRAVQLLEQLDGAATFAPAFRDSQETT